MTFGYLLALAVCLGIPWLVLSVRKIGAVRRGQQIGKREKEALLLIDLQSVFWTRGPYSDAAKQSAQTVILKEIEAARLQGNSVIAIRQEWSIPSTKAIALLTMKGQAIEGSIGTELAEPFAGLTTHVLVKRVQDAFETGELDALFAKLSVGKLRIVGLDLNHCVLKTALAARNRGYEVLVVMEGTLSAAPTDRAQELMAAHSVALP